MTSSIALANDTSTWLGNPEPEAPGGPPVLDTETYEGIVELMGAAGGMRLLTKLADQLSVAPFDLAHSDVETLASRAHKLASAAGMLGFARFSTLCRELDSAHKSGAPVRGALEPCEVARKAVLAQIAMLQAAA